MKKMKTKIIVLAMLLGIFGLLNITTVQVEAQEASSYSLTSDEQGFNENNPLNTTILRQALGYWEASICLIGARGGLAENFPSNALD